MATNPKKPEDPPKARVTQFMDRQSWTRVAAYCIMGFFVILAFAVQANDRASGRRSVCLAILEDRQLVADIIGNTQSSVQDPIDPTLDPAIIRILEDARESQRNFLSEAQERLIQPIEICQRVGIDSTVIIRDSEGRELAPLPAPGVTSPTTPTTTSTTGAATEEATATTVRSTTGSTSAPASPSPTVVVVQGPAGPQGPPGPPGTTAPTTTTTLPPTTTTTAPPPGLLCSLLGIGC